MGARQTADLKRQISIANPDYACCLNIGQAHVGIFGSYEALFKAKMEIFTNSLKTKAFIGNGDNPKQIDFFKQNPCKSLTFGEASHNDIVLHRADGMHFEITPPRGETEHLTNITRNEAYPINIAAVAAMLSAASLPLGHLTSLVNFKGSPGRYAVTEKGNFTLIDDTYNANPASMTTGLLSVMQAYPKRPKIFILGDMLELGSEESKEHKKIGQLLCPFNKDDRLITVGNVAKLIGDEILKQGGPSQGIRHFGDAEALLSEGIGNIEGLPVIYAKGSRGIKLDRIIEALQTKD